MKKIISIMACFTSILLCTAGTTVGTATQSMAEDRDKVTHIANFANVEDASLNIYTTSNSCVRRIELLTPYLTRREAQKRYAEIIRRFEKDQRYTRLNGGKSQVLFMEGSLQKTILVARLKSIYGYRIAIAYDENKEE